MACLHEDGVPVDASLLETPSTRRYTQFTARKAAAPRSRDAKNSQDTAADRVQRLVPRVDALLEGALEGTEGHGLGGGNMFIK